MGYPSLLQRDESSRPVAADAAAWTKDSDLGGKWAATWTLTMVLRAWSWDQTSRHVVELATGVGFAMCAQAVANLGRFLTNRAVRLPIAEVARCSKLSLGVRNLAWQGSAAHLTGITLRTRTDPFRTYVERPIQLGLGRRPGGRGSPLRRGHGPTQGTACTCLNRPDLQGPQPFTGRAHHA